MDTNTKPTAHTPGPWHAECRDGDMRIIAVEDDQRIARINEDMIDANDMPSYSSEAHANARLIAAAPEMLNALELALVTIRRLAKTDSANGTMDVVRAAITKATGTGVES
jgi:hypothetical protein